MPFYYDLNRPVATNATSATELTHFFINTIANQETASIVGIYAAAQFGTAGGAQLRIKDNSSSTSTSTSSLLATLGSSFIFNPKNRRAYPTSQTLIHTTSTTTIVPGTGGLYTRLTVGFAQTGGMGGYVPIVPSAAIQLMPNATNPVDVEIVSIATSASVTFDATVEIAEGI